ncbi:MAG: hypothetical protein ACO29U_10485 [Crocinitomicaceae bacterium]
MLDTKKFPKNYDGFYFLPPDNAEDEGLVFQFFSFTGEMSNGSPIENTSVGDKFHIAFFKEGDDGHAVFDDAFEAIFADPVVYIDNLSNSATNLYGCVCRKTDKSEKWFENYLLRTTNALDPQKIINLLKSVVKPQ